MLMSGNSTSAGVSSLLVWLLLCIFSNWIHPLPPESEHSMETLCADVGRDSIRRGMGRRIHRPRRRRVGRV